MRLVVPYVGELHAVDDRLIRIAEFLGIECELLCLSAGVADHVAYLKGAGLDRQACLAFNLHVMRKWIGDDALPSDFVPLLLSRFSYLFVHGVQEHACDSNIVAALSKGGLRSVRALDDANSPYEIASGSGDICGAFSGLSFGPINPSNDRVFAGASGDSAVRPLISIGGAPFMAVTERGPTRIFFLGSDDIANLDAEVGDSPIAEYFSRFLPHAMVLRHIFGQACWGAEQCFACVVVDDPLLRRTYGYLDFESLLSLMNQHHFHTTVAFIPHNFRRSSPRITRMFLENPSRFSLCFHGNDHTGAEFASSDKPLLNTFLSIAEKRMDIHHERTGLVCDRVMVFPQGNFSVEAMEVLRSRNFHGAVNTVTHPRGATANLTIRELAQPAVLRYGGFPLFLRKPSHKTLDEDIAFDAFFGKPILIVEHHDIFREPGTLLRAVSRINAMVPAVRWAGLGEVVENSILKRRGADRTIHIRGHSNRIRISNGSNSAERYSVEWRSDRSFPPAEQALQDGAPAECFTQKDGVIQVLTELPAGGSRTFAVLYRNDHIAFKKLGLRWNTKAFLRRRLSEARDNYLSKNPNLQAAAKALQRSVRN